MDRERNVDPAIGRKSCTSPDEAIARLAEGQPGVVARAQLLAIGLGGRAIEHRLEKGRLHPVFRAVYAVGHRRLSRTVAGWRPF